MQDDLFISPRELLAVLFRRRYGILGIFLSCIAAAIFSVYYLISPTYQAQATIIINTSYLTEPLRDGPPESEFEKLAYFHTQRDIIASDRMAAEAVKRTRLAERRVIGRIERIEIGIGDAKRWAGRLLGIEKWQRPWDPTAAAVEAVSEAIRTFALPDSKALKVTLRAKDPKEAAEVLDALLKAHQEYYYSGVRKKAAGAVAFLESEFERSRSALRTAELDLYKLRKSERVALDPRGNAVVGKQNSSLLGVTDTANIQQEIRLYLLRLEEELRVATLIPDNERRERITADIRNRIQRYIASLNSMPERELELVRLKRQFDIAQDNYQLVQRNLQRARLVATGETDEIRLVEMFEAPSESEDIVFPRKRLVLLLAGIVGVAFALTWAFVADYLDHSLRNRRDVDRFLKVRLIASLPRIAPR